MFLLFSMPLTISYHSKCKYTRFLWLSWLLPFKETSNTHMYYIYTNSLEHNILNISEHNTYTLQENTHDVCLWAITHRAALQRKANMDLETKLSMNSIN